MRVYRNASKEFNSNTLFPLYLYNGEWYADSSHQRKCIAQPIKGDLVHTGSEFQTITTPLGTNIVAGSYYLLSSIDENGYAVWVESSASVISVFDIMECVYNGQDMGKRSVTATIKYSTPIDFHIGDYIEIDIQSLVQGEGKSGIIGKEKFYIYTEPQCKKTARPMSAGDAFETTVVFYPRQYELSTVQMRDFINNPGDGTPIVYTGFDEVTFYGGAHELLERCMACLRQQFVDNDGNDLWSYDLADEVDEVENTALEKFAFSFSGQSVMDALLKLNDKEGINTTFSINERKIYVGYKRPYFCTVKSNGDIDETPLRMMYGKTSHMPIDLEYGGLFDITKSVGEELPITKLFAYGAARNLNRYYCADRIKSGRFVNKLMLPSFSDDGVTDFVLSENGVKKYGIVEGSHSFEEIYPSLRYMTYADIRGIKYCIKVRGSGLNSDPSGKYEHLNSISAYPIARVQCYKVVPSATDGVNTLVESAPPEDLAIFIHATGKTVKTVLCGGATNNEAISKQLARDRFIPTTNGNTPVIGGNYSHVHPGSCFCVHDPLFDGDTESVRNEWFDKPTAVSDIDSNIHRIEYVDTFWLTDLYVFDSYNQTHFLRDGYSAWAWPRLNSDSLYPDSLLVNEVVAVEPVVIPDTSDNINGGRQQHFDIYLRDIGFALDEQNDFGEMVFVYNTPVVSVLDNVLAGREFNIDGGSLNDYQDRVICAYKEDGTLNNDFFYPGDSGDSLLPHSAFAEGAVWRIRLNRNNKDEENIGLILPNTELNMSAGDHIVFLDIYMPDIYVRAAENRLLREARKFLDSNDKGNIKYAVSFDKVRIQQIPNYALQMREGLMLRVVDEDLNITSDNVVRKLVEYANGASYEVPLYTEVKETKEITESTLHKFYADDEPGLPKFADSHEWDSAPSMTTGHIVFYVPKNKNAFWIDDQNVKIGCSYRSASGEKTPDNIEIEDFGDRWKISFDLVAGTFEYQDLVFSEVVYLRVVEKVYRAEYSKGKTEGVSKSAICKDLIEFHANKHYEVVVDVDEHWDDENDEITLTTNVSYGDNEYEPTYTREEIIGEDVETGFRRMRYSFYLPNEFNDKFGYYVSLNYIEDGENDYGRIKMVSVVEKDLDETGKKIDYVDFVVSNVSIKISENTRPDDTRILGAHPEPIREIQAQINEQSKASTWGQLMNNIQELSIEVEKSQKLYETLTKASRDNYQRILALRNSLFDPDGSIKDVFLQTMMLQVGADSMNYQLVKTYSLPDGQESSFHNFSVGQENGEGNDYFKVFSKDKMYHFVYTQGSQGGVWTIPGNFSKELIPVDDVYPVYYICLKCRRDIDNFEDDVVWICDTVQHAVNEDSSYWYFNWGILTPIGTQGRYAFSETRGNAYMYGDNIIAGKISTLAGQSYFDLTHGNFVLSEGTEENAALSYVKGVLKIAGVDASNISTIIEELNLLDGIGGENLLFVNELNETYEFEWDGGPVFHELTYFYEQNSASQVVRTHTFFPAGKYVFSADGVDYETQSDRFDMAIYLCAINSSGTITKVVEVTKGNVRDLQIETVEACYFSLRVWAYSQEEEQASEAWTILHNMQLQKGTKSTSFNQYYKHLSDALHGTTDFAGGLTMTNLLLLKNLNGDVTAGMSGLSSENIALFAGGTYYQALAGMVPVRITKNGIGSKIGCFEVISATEVQVNSALGKIRIDTASGGIRIIKNGYDKIVIIPESIKKYIPDVVPSESITKLGVYPAKLEYQIPQFHSIYTFTTDIPITASFTNLTYVGKVSCMFAGSPFVGDVKVHIKFALYDHSTGTIIQYHPTEKVVYANGQTQTDFTLSWGTQPLQANLEAGTYTICLWEELAEITSGTYAGQTASTNYRDDPSSVSAVVTVQKTPIVANLSVLGTDGLIVAKDANHFFGVDNSGQYQKIVANGLPNSDPGSIGQLWYDVTNDTIRISRG